MKAQCVNDIATPQLCGWLTNDLNYTTTRSKPQGKCARSHLSRYRESRALYSAQFGLAKTEPGPMCTFDPGRET